MVNRSVEAANAIIAGNSISRIASATIVVPSACVQSRPVILGATSLPFG
jgi:hypothetical protein